MENTVNTRPSFPAVMACCKFMPKPKPTTEAFSSQPVALWLKFANGSPDGDRQRKPSSSAMGGLIAGLRQSSIAMMNTALRACGPTCRGGPLSVAGDASPRVSCSRGLMRVWRRRKVPATPGSKGRR